MTNHKWLLIGASNIAERVLPAIRALPGQEVVAVFSHNATRAGDFAKQFAIPQHGNNLEALLHSCGADIAYISSTNEHHHPQALASLKAGLHLLCEKPLAMSLDEGRSILQTAQAAKRVVAVNHHLRASGAHHWMRSQIQEGAIGSVHSVQLSHAVYLPPHLQGWRLTSPTAGGGVVLDILVHDVDLLRFLLNAEPVSVMSRVSTAGLASAGLEDNAMHLIDFDNGVIAQTHESFVARYTKTHLHIMGDKGAIYATGSLTQAGNAEIWLRTEQGEKAIAIPKTDLYLYIETMKALLAEIEGQGRALASGLDGFRSMSVALSALRSAHSKGIEKVALQ